MIKLTEFEVENLILQYGGFVTREEALNFCENYPNQARKRANEIERSKTSQQFRYGEGNINEL